MPRTPTGKILHRKLRDKIIMKGDDNLIAIRRTPSSYK
jgi:acyl-coenzyme A synthetase/AMP-(fatty) acid ligase